MTQDQVENLLSEDRTFPPSPEFAANANVKADEYKKADEDRIAFWESQAEYLKWEKRWHTEIGRAHV